MTTERTRRRFTQATGGLTAVALAGCTGTTNDGGSTEEPMDEETMTGDTTDDGGMDNGMAPTDPADAPRATVDRFSDAAGTLHIRSDNLSLPAADGAIDFDETFLTQGFGPDGSIVQYYDFDIQPTTPRADLHVRPRGRRPSRGSAQRRQCCPG